MEEKKEDYTTAQDIINNMGEGKYDGTKIITEEKNIGDTTKIVIDAAATSNKNQQLGTGAGLGSAADGKYAWDRQAEDIAGGKYGQDLATAEQNVLASRRNIEKNAVEGSINYALGNYSANQNAEKYGWTGGYKLDTDMQMEYMKASIAADMYGQLELQKQGYDTQMAAARYAYDTNKKELAMQYYQQAYQNSIQEAEMTGVWLSPEVKDSLDNYNLALRTIEEGATDPEKQNTEDYKRATRLKSQIESWFLDNKISPTGIMTLSYISQLQGYQMNDAQIEQLIKEGVLTEVNIEYSLATTRKDISERGNFAVEKVNENGVVYGYDEIDPRKDYDKAREYFNENTSALDSFLNQVNSEYEASYRLWLEQTGKKDTQFSRTEFEESSTNPLVDHLLRYGHGIYYDVKFEDTKKIKQEIKNGKLFVKGIDTGIAHEEGNEYKLGIDRNGKVTVNGNKTNIDADYELEYIKENFATNDGKTYKVEDILEGKTIQPTNPNANDHLTDDELKYVINTSNVSEVYSKLNELGVRYEDKTLLTVDELSEGTDKIKQNDYGKKESKNEAGLYIDAMINAVNNNEIKPGQIVQLNYGDIKVNRKNYHIFMYIGNGQFARLYSKDKKSSEQYESISNFFENNKVFIPKGYRQSYIGGKEELFVTKK